MQFDRRQAMPGTRSGSRRAAIAIVGAVAAIAIGACGEDEGSTASAGGSPATVVVADNDDLGAILADSDQRTLYLFEKDAADESSCAGACAKAWPPLILNGTPQAGDGVDAGQLSTLKRDDGKTQVAYARHPLYLYAGDASPGEVNGNGLDQFGAEWYAVDSEGQAVKSPADDESSGSGSGYGGY
jgi:predicted lipoprotein with Yx(FWY)xxD motif